VESPHERAWREALSELMAGDWRAAAARSSYRPERFTSVVYQAHVAGKPRSSGARAVLDYFDVPDAEQRTPEYAERKQRRIRELIDAGEFVAFPDGVRFALALQGSGMRLAAASSSKNANDFLVRTRLDAFGRQDTLLDLFDINVCGRDLPFGKPHPQIFLAAAEELGAAPATCLVVEDAPTGIQAAKAAGMAAIGVARLHDEDLLQAAQADLIVSTLDEVAVSALLKGRLERLSGSPTASGASHTYD